MIRFLGGMAAGNGSVIQGYIADVTAPEDRAGRMANLGAAYNIGFILGPVAGGFLAKPSAGPIGFQIPLLAASALAGISSFGILMLVRESRRARPVDPNPASRWAVIGFAARHPVVGRLMLLTFVVGFAFTGIESVFGLWAHHRFAWQPRDVGLCFAISGLVSSPTQFFITGTLSRRFGEARMLAVGMVGTVIAMTLIPFGDGRWTTYALMAMMALLLVGRFPQRWRSPDVARYRRAQPGPDHGPQQRLRRLRALRRPVGGGLRLFRDQCRRPVFPGSAGGGPGDPAGARRGKGGGKGLGGH